MMPVSQHEFRLEHWQEWSRRNRQIFDALRPGSKIGFLSKEELAAFRGRVLILQVAEPNVESYLADFTGFRQDLADVLFVAPGDALTAIERAAGPNEGSRLLKDLLRRGQILFYCLSPQTELEAKGFDDFFSDLGLLHLGGCVS